MGQNSRTIEFNGTGLYNRFVELWPQVSLRKADSLGQACANAANSSRGNPESKREAELCAEIMPLEAVITSLQSSCKHLILSLRNGMHKVM